MHNAQQCFANVVNPDVKSSRWTNQQLKMNVDQNNKTCSLPE